jgi:hypothetical protein
MTLKQIALALVAVADVSVVSWIVQSSLEKGTIAAGSFQTKLITRDGSPIAFWFRIASFVSIGLAILATALGALLSA